MNENTTTNTQGGEKRGEINKDGKITKGGIIAGAVAAVGFVLKEVLTNPKTILQIGKIIISKKSK